jgi:Zn-dependent protease with chaperone function
MVPTMRGLVIVLLIFLAGCAGKQTRQVEEAELQRLAALMAPLEAPLNPKPNACPLVAKTEQINAAVTFAASTDKGRCTHSLIVTEGAFQSLTDEQLQAVLAHELSHYTLGHLDAYAQRHKIKLAFKTVFRVISQITLIGYAIGTVGSLATDAVSNAYTREDETAADLEGAKFLQEASVKWTGPNRPSGCDQMAKMLEVLRQHSGDSLWEDYLGGHPSLGTRIQAVQAYCAGLPQAS